MRIKHVGSAYVFEANDDAAKELIARGDYEKASNAESLTDEAIIEIAKKPAKKKS